jgi:hypothetical protein
MVRRVWLMLVLALSGLLGGSAAFAQRPAAAQRIVAIGDLHGDYAAWTAIARAAGLIDDQGRWAGKNTILVQSGDIPDRGPDSARIMRQIMRLQREAPRKGGQVIALVGNHEAMNMIGDLRYVDPGEYAALADANSQTMRERAFDSMSVDIIKQFRAANPSVTDVDVRRKWLEVTPLGWVEHRLAWRPSGEFGRWVVRNPAVAMVQGNLFVHGGISAEYSKIPIAQINRRVRTALESNDQAPTSIISDPIGPLWYRGLVAPDPEVRPSPLGELTTVLSAYGAKRIVIAHTPLLSGIKILDGGRLVRIDSGNSRYYNGHLSYLEILGDQLIPHTVPRSGR